MPETLWRCTRCEKWSHAKRRPGHHHRFVAERAIADTTEVETKRTLDGLPVERWEPGVGCWIRCGPFQEWAALLMER